ncbi:MAG: amidase family protein, partial [Dehalococcoidales bacterium]
WSPDLGYAVVDPEVLEVTAAAARVFESTGATLDEAGIDIEHPGGSFAAIWAVTFASKYTAMLDEWRDEMDPRLVRMVERGAGITANQYAQAATAREEFWQKIRPCFEKFDFLLTPTLAVAAFDVSQFEVTEIGGVQGSPGMDWTPFSYPFNFTGQPAASVPCGWTKDGLPIGLQIVGRRFDDIGVLKVAAAFEKAAPWGDKRPDLD